MHPRVASLHAAVPENLKPYVSIESLIDQVLGNLLSQCLANRGLTHEEQQDFDSLMMERARHIRPPPIQKRKPGLLMQLNERLYHLS